MVPGKRLIANPNCTTAIAAVALWPLHQRFKLKKLIVSTYQAASGAGAEVGLLSFTFNHSRTHITYKMSISTVIGNGRTAERHRVQAKRRGCY